MDSDWRELLRNLDFVLLGAVVLATTMGIVTIYYASIRGEGLEPQSFYFRQIAWASVGLVAMVTAACIDYRRWIALAPVLYFIALSLLIAVPIAGVNVQGATRWLDLFGFRLQPSELFKIVIVLAITRYLDSLRGKIQRLPYFLGALGIVAVPTFLILTQPDLGSAVIFFPILFALLFLGGARLSHLFLTALSGVLAMPIAWHSLKDYQKQRLLAFIDPNADPSGTSYQSIQSKIAVGGGQITGKGWLAATQTRLDFLPESHTDFIFAVFGEARGFVGCVLMLLLFAVIVGCGIKISLQARDFRGSILAAGITSMMAVHILINLSVVLGLMPVTGLPLPFFSYGGSSLVTMMFAVGLLLNVKMRSKIFSYVF